MKVLEEVVVLDIQDYKFLWKMNSNNINIELFIQHFFPQESYELVEEYVKNLNNINFDKFINMPFKNPNNMFFMAFPLGIFGIDRFMLDEIGLGLIKLFTLGNFLIGFIIDTFTIIDRTKNYNFNLFLKIKTGINF